MMKRPRPRRLYWTKPALFGAALWLLAAMSWPTSIAQNPQSKRQLEKESAKNAQRRIALVIGNGTYENANRLAKPPNDAEDVGAALRRLGFELVGDSAHVNQSADQMKRLIVNFGEMLNAGGVGLFYYAGHGVQSQGHNYLIPVEANILRERTLEFDALDVNRVLAQMDAAGNGFNIVILDACRNNPFTRSWRDASQGLAQVNAPDGTLIAYSTSPGRVASDGTGRNGTYTAALLRQMNSPGLTIEEMFKAVRVSVRTATKDQQTPWESSSLVGTFCFAGDCGSKNPGGNTKSGGDADGEFWSTIRNSSDPADFRAYLKTFPNGRYVSIAQNNLRRLNSSAPTTNSEAVDNTPNKSASIGSALLRFDGLYYAPKPQRAGYIRLYSDGTFVGTGGSKVSADEITLSKEKDLPQGTYIINGDRITFTYLKFATLTQHHGVIRQDSMQITYPDGTMADYLFATWSDFKNNTGQDVSTQQSSRVEQDTQNQPPIQTVKSNLYTFDLQCRLSGNTVICDLVITNNDRDRKFSFDNIVNGAGMMDNFGAAYQATSLQIANRNGFDDAIIPSNIPIKSRVIFDNVSAQATQIVSLRMQFNRYDPGINNTFRIEFRDVPLSR